MSCIPLDAITPYFVVAVDGPAGAGKGVLCRALADCFNLAYLDTGALYRAVALLGLQNGIEETYLLAQQVEKMEFVFRKEQDGEYLAYLNQQNVTLALRNEQVAAKASQWAADTGIRAALYRFQRSFGQQQDAILDGRDIGSVVWPEAQVKIFLTASSQERAKRRAEELQQRGEVANFATILAAIEARDVRDSTRSHSPLLATTDAIVVDSTALTISEVFAHLEPIVSAKKNSFKRMTH